MSFQVTDLIPGTIIIAVNVGGAENDVGHRGNRQQRQ